MLIVPYSLRRLYGSGPSGVCSLPAARKRVEVCRCCDPNLDYGSTGDRRLGTWWERENREETESTHQCRPQSDNAKDINAQVDNQAGIRYVVDGRWNEEEGDELVLSSIIVVL